ncbi:MAG: ribonuclease HI [Xanthomonadales bacterium]|jgi:ribonuclease HI|nr:ribonuclease HI [Xanthomonadales bacterium]
MKQVQIYTDGGCRPNPGPGAWAALLRYGAHERELAGYEAQTTNNRMELTAALKGLEALKNPCEVDLYTDSNYLKQGMSEWLSAWKRRGWRTADKKPVLNEDLWRALDAAAATHRVRWHWVRGHSGHVENERVDALVTATIQAGKVSEPC